MNYARTSHCPKISVCSTNGSLARIGGAPAAGQRASRFATARTKAPASRRKRRTLPKPKPSRGAAASIRRTRRSATAATAGWAKRNYWRFFPPGSFSFLRKKYWVSATLSIERSRPVGGAFPRDFELARDAFDGGGGVVFHHAHAGLGFENDDQQAMFVHVDDEDAVFFALLVDAVESWFR